MCPSLCIQSTRLSTVAIKNEHREFWEDHNSGKLNQFSVAHSEHLQLTPLASIPFSYCFQL